MQKRQIHPLILIWLLVVTLFLGVSFELDGSSARSYHLTRLGQDLDVILADPLLSRSHVGLFVQSMETGEIITAHNPHKYFVPASVMKLVTAAITLDELGSKYTYSTQLYAAGKIRNGVLQGDLLVKGGGDPTSGSQLSHLNPHRIFHRWAEILKKHGIRRIKGDILLNARCFDDEPWGAGWMIEDIPYWWGAETAGLQFHQNVVRVYVSSNANHNTNPTGNIDANQTAATKIDYFPNTELIEIKNKVRLTNQTNSSAISFRRGSESNLVVVSGQIAAGDVVTENIAVHDPVLYFGTELKSALQTKGIIITGNLRQLQNPQDDLDPNALSLIHTEYSPIIASICRSMLKQSNNLYAETLVKTLAMDKSGKGNYSTGLSVINEKLADWGIAPDEYRIADGSGLSRYNQLTPKMLVTLLRQAYSHNWFDVFLESLPIAGQDGTLGKRFQSSAAAGRILAKTGSMQGIYTLAGYFTSMEGELFAFAFLINSFNQPSEAVGYLQDLVLERLVAGSAPIPSSDRSTAIKSEE